MKHLFPAMFVLFLLITGGCATIPKQAPALSEELGLKLTSIQKSHIKLLHNYFDMKREKVDEFINKEWLPAFANEIFNKPDIKDAWDEIVKSGNKEDRLKFIILTGPRLQTKINEKRKELIKPLDDLEQDIEYRIRNEYDIAKGINNSLTSFLYSAVKVEENRKRYLEMLGITDEVVDKVINETDNIVSNMVLAGEKAVDKEELARVYIEKLKSLKEKLNTNQ
jgi:hypothetical protein